MERGVILQKGERVAVLACMGFNDTAVSFPACTTYSLNTDRNSASENYFVVLPCLLFPVIFLGKYFNRN